MTGIEPANNGVTIHCLNHLATPAIFFNFNCSIFLSAKSISLFISLKYFMSKTDFNIRINGEPFHCTHSMTIYDLLSYLGIDFSANIVEHNHDIVDFSKLKCVFLQESDEIEIITLVGGG